MSPRNRLLLLLFLLTAAAALWRSRPWEGDLHARTEARVHRLFPELAAALDRVAEVRVESEGRTTTLALEEGEGWVVREKLNHPADAGRLLDLLDAMARLDDRDVVSTNPEKFPVYHVAEGQGTRVRVRDRQGRLLADLVVGSLRGQDPARSQVLLEFYLRPADRDLVVLVQGFHLPLTHPEDWIDGRLFPAIRARDLAWLERDDRQGDEDWRLERVIRKEDGQEGGPAGTVEHGWRMVRPEERPALDFAGDSFAFTFAGLRAADVVARLAAGREAEQLREYGFATDVFRAGTGERILEVQLGGLAPEGGRYCRTPDRDWIYVLEDFEVDQLRQSVADMLPEAGDRGQ